MALELITVTAENVEQAVNENFRRVYQELSYKIPRSGKVVLKGPLDFGGLYTITGPGPVDAHSGWSEWPTVLPEGQPPFDPEDVYTLPYIPDVASEQAILTLPGTPPPGSPPIYLVDITDGSVGPDNWNVTLAPGVGQYPLPVGGFADLEPTALFGPSPMTIVPECVNTYQSGAYGPGLPLMFSADDNVLPAAYYLWTVSFGYTLDDAITSLHDQYSSGRTLPSGTDVFGVVYAYGTSVPVGMQAGVHSDETPIDLRATISSTTSGESFRASTIVFACQRTDLVAYLNSFGL